jgi:hypothetical protein
MPIFRHGVAKQLLERVLGGNMKDYKQRMAKKNKDSDIFWGICSALIVSAVVVYSLIGWAL